MQYIPLVGRILFSAVFLMFGLGHLTAPGDMVGLVPDFVPAKSVVVILTGIAIIAGGLMILVGYRAKLGAQILAGFVIVTALIVHLPGFLEGDQVSTGMFLKDMSLGGAALLISHFGSGPMSLDDRGGD